MISIAITAATAKKDELMKKFLAKYKISILISLFFVFVLSIYGILKPLLEASFLVFSILVYPAIATFLAWLILFGFWVGLELEKKFDLDSLIYLGSIVLIILIILITPYTWSNFQ